MSNYFYPGIGFGGYCLPKYQCITLTKKNKPKILNSVNLVNKEIFNFQLRKILKNTNKSQIFIY